MASGMAVKLPLAVDNVFGPYNLITDFQSLAVQNLKMVILTNPGERMMDTNFGAGVRRRLFEPRLPSTLDDIRSQILKQVNIYLPYIKILDIDFLEAGDLPTDFPYDLKIKIYFKIIPLQISSELEIGVNAGNN